MLVVTSFINKVMNGLEVEFIDTTNQIYSAQGRRRVPMSGQYGSQN